MNAIEIRIPQLGEGLREARIVRLAKQPGDMVVKDAVLFEIETDKATMEIEAPVSGVVLEWLVGEDDIAPVGMVIGRLSLDPLSASTPRNASVSPRVKAYARQHGLSDTELLELAARVAEPLMPGHIDQHIAERLRSAPQERSGFHDSAISSTQRTLIYRLQRGLQPVIPATIESVVPWYVIEQVRARWIPGRHVMRRPSRFLLFAWCVARAAQKHAFVRSAVIDDRTLRTYDHVNVGIAVARPNDEMLMARIDDADALSFERFHALAEQAIARARQGDDQTSDSMQLSLTNMASAGVRSASPVVAAPAMGTLFLGAPYEQPYRGGDGQLDLRSVANIAFTFDHRLANGIGAARFIDLIGKNVLRLPREFADSLIN